MSHNESTAPAGRHERMTSLHDVVLNYLQTHAYASTARTLVEGRPGTLGDQSGGGSALYTNGAVGASYENGSTGGTISHDDGMEVDDGGTMQVKRGNAEGKGKEKAKEGVRLDEEDLVAIERRQAILNHILNGAIMRAVDALNTYFPSVLDDSPSALSTSTNGSHGKSASNGHSLSSSPTTVSNLGRRVSSGWSNSLGSGGSLWNSPSAPCASSAAYPSNGATAATGTNGHSNGSGRTSLGNGNSNGNGGSSYDYALPVMHLSLHPAHVKLNLSIQAFIESFRQLAPSSSPSTPSSSVGDLSGSMSMSMSTSIHVPSGAGKGPAAGGPGLSSSAVTLTNALTAAQGLHAEAKKLDPEDRAVYLQEIKDVGALLAYTDPETSILKGFLEQTRRIALADQVNRAILCSEGRQTTSRLEQYARRTTALWTIMAERGIDAQPSWTAADGHGKEQLGAYWKGQSKSGFKLRDFVSHSYA